MRDIDEAVHCECNWNPNLRDGTWLKLPSSECVQRGTVKKLVARAWRHFGVCHETRVGIDRHPCHTCTDLPLRSSLIRVLGPWRICGERLRTTDLPCFIRGEAVICRRVNQQKYQNNLTNRSAHFFRAKVAYKNKILARQPAQSMPDKILLAICRMNWPACSRVSITLPASS